MTLCSPDVIEHLTKLGHTEAVNEINKLLNKDKAQNLRWRKYGARLKEFAKNFGVWDAYRSGQRVELEYEECGPCPYLEDLAKNINGEYYESADEAICAEYDESGNKIVVKKVWFDNIMHLWINIYQDQDFDIFQSRLKVKEA